MTKTFIRYFVIATLIVLGAFFFITLFTQTRPFKNFFKGAIEKTISTALNQEFRIERLDGNLLKGFELKRVYLEIDGKPFITADNLRFRYSFLVIFNSSLLIDKLIPLENAEVDNLKIYLSRNEDGVWNYMKISRQYLLRRNKKLSRKRPKWSLFLKRAQLRNSVIFVNDRIIDQEVEYSFSTLDFSLRYLSRLKELRANLRRADLDINPFNVHFRGAQSIITYKDKKASFDDLYFNLNGMLIRLNGTIKNPKKPLFEVSGSIIGIEAYEGTINAAINNAIGTITKEKGIQATMDIKILESEYLGQKFSGTIDNLTINGSTFEAKTSTINSGNGSATIKGSMDLLRLFKKKGKNTINGTIYPKDFPNVFLQTLIPEIMPEAKITGGNVELTGSWTTEKDISAHAILNNVQGSGEFGSIQAGGTIDHKDEMIDIDLQIKASNLDLSKYISEPEYKTSINTTLDFTGRAPVDPNDPTFKTRIIGTVQQSKIVEMPITTGNYDIFTTEAGTFIKTLNLSSPDMKLTASTPSIGEPVPFELKLNDLSYFKSVFPDSNLKGSLTAKGTLLGDFYFPKLVMGSEFNNLSFYSLSARHGVISTELDMTIPDFLTNFNANISNMFIDKRKFKNITLTSTKSPDGIRGNIAIDEKKFSAYEIDFTLNNLNEPQKNIEIQMLKYITKNNSLQNKEPISISLGEQSVRVSSFNLHFKENFVLGSFDYDFKGPINGSLSFNKMNLKDLYEIFNLGENHLEGIATGSVKVAGTLKKPSFATELRIKDFIFIDLKSSDARLSTKYSNNNLSFSLLFLDEAKREIFNAKANGTINIDLNNVDKTLDSALMNFSINSHRCDLSSLANLSKDIKRLKGFGSVNIEGSGPLLHPVLNGSLKLSEITLVLNDISNPFIVESGEIRFNGKKHELRSLLVKSKKGSGLFNGHFNSSDYSYNLKGELDNFLLKPKGIKANIDGNLELNSSDGLTSIGGAVVIKKGKVKIPEIPTKQLEDIKFVVQEGKEQEEVEFAISENEKLELFEDTLAIDIDVTVNNNFWIKGQGVNIEIEGNFRVYKDYTTPITILGEEIKIIRGSYEILGKTFTLEEGKISFRGEPGINPFLDIKANHKVSNMLIKVSITGTANEPVITLTSDPPLDQTDIFSFLMFGTSVSNLGTGERATLQGKVAEVVSQMAAGKIKNILGDALGIDVITITGGNKEFEGTQLEVGKYFTDRFYIAYERTVPLSSLNPEGITRNIAKVELQLFDFLTVESTIGGANSGGDLFFNWSY